MPERIFARIEYVIRDFKQLLVIKQNERGIIMNGMKRLTSKVLAFMLTGALMAGNLSVPAFAAENEGTVGNAATLTAASEASLEDYATDATDTMVGESDLASANETAAFYTVTLDANGGYFIDELDDVLNETVEKTEVLNKTIAVGETISIIPVRVGFKPTFLSIISEFGTIRAAAIKYAALEISPGISMVLGSRDDFFTVTFSPFTEISAPI